MTSSQVRISTVHPSIRPSTHSIPSIRPPIVHPIPTTRSRPARPPAVWSRRLNQVHFAVPWRSVFSREAQALQSSTLETVSPKRHSETPVPLKPPQLRLASVRIASSSGSALGITVGCIIGMFPLLFMGNRDSPDEGHRNVSGKSATVGGDKGAAEGVA